MCPALSLIFRVILVLINSYLILLRLFPTPTDLCFSAQKLCLNNKNSPFSPQAPCQHCKGMSTLRCSIKMQQLLDCCPSNSTCFLEFHFLLLWLDSFPTKRSVERLSRASLLSSPSLWIPKGAVTAFPPANARELRNIVCIPVVMLLIVFLGSLHWSHWHRDDSHNYRQAFEELASQVHYPLPDVFGTYLC